MGRVAAMLSAITGAMVRERYWKKPAAVLFTMAVALPCMLVALAAGTAQAAVIPPMTWSAPTQVDPNGIYALDCPSANLCVGGDSLGNIVTSTKPTGGSSAWHITATGDTAEILSISCPSPSFCAAGDLNGNVLTSSNPAGGASAWHMASAVSPGPIDGLSCPDASLCVALDSYYLNDVLTSTDPDGGASAWHTVSLGTRAFGGTVSCPDSSLCVATTANSDDLLVSTNPTGGAAAWRTVAAPGMGDYVAGLSCPSTSLCVAESISTSAVASSLMGITSSTDPAGPASAWHAVNAPGVLTLQIPALSCASKSACFLAGGGYTFLAGAKYTASSATPAGPTAAWHVALAPAEFVDLTALSCPTAYLCVAYADGIVTGTATPPAATTTTLRLSAPKIIFGHERAEHLSVIVRSRHSGVPSGEVVILAGTNTICRQQLHDGKASCTLSSKQLRRGKYLLRARYVGSVKFNPSTSRPERLYVIR